MPLLLVATMLVSLAADAHPEEAPQRLATECRPGQTGECARAPDDRTAIGTARSWVHAVMDGDVKLAVTMTALPFELTVENSYYRSKLGVRPGPVLTRARLLEVLAALTKFCHSEGCCATRRPRVAVHVRTAGSGVRIVSFIPDGNKLADGSYFNVDVHVDPSTGLVVRALFDGFHTG